MCNYLIAHFSLVIFQSLNIIFMLRFQLVLIGCALTCLSATFTGCDLIGQTDQVSRGMMGSGSAAPALLAHYCGVRNLTTACARLAAPLNEQAANWCGCSCSDTSGDTMSSVNELLCLENNSVNPSHQMWSKVTQGNWACSSVNLDESRSQKRPS